MNWKRERKSSNTSRARMALPGLLLLGLSVGQGSPSWAQVPDRSAPPEIGPPPSLSLPEVHQLELSNGLRVVLMEKHNVPLVQVDLVIGTGAVADPAGLNGLASLTADMLDEGVAGRDALEFADAVGFLGAQLQASAGYHTTTVRLHTPLSRLGQSLPLMADMVLRPDFPEEELERRRLDRLTTMLQWHDEPRAIGSALFNQSIFGSEHPYGRNPFGDAESITSVGVEDVRDFYGRHYRPNNATLIVVGDVEPNAIRSGLDEAFGSWESEDVPTSTVPTAAQVSQRRLYLVDKPGAAQSEIYVGRLGTSRMTVDYFPLVVMNTILGGSFASRLNQNLRERNQYSYGARSSFSFRPAPGPFSARASVQTAVTDKALVEFMKELRAIREPVAEEELDRARNYVALRYPGRFQTVSGIAAQLADLVVYDLPKTYLEDYVGNTLAVTRADVSRVAQEYLDPEKVVIVVVGDLSVIEEGIRALGLGPIEELSIEDVLGAPPDLGGN